MVAVSVSPAVTVPAPVAGCEGGEAAAAVQVSLAPAETEQASVKPAWMVMTPPALVAWNRALSGRPEAGSGVVAALRAAAMAAAAGAAGSPAATVYATCPAWSLGRLM